MILSMSVELMNSMILCEIWMIPLCPLMTFMKGHFLVPSPWKGGYKKS